MNFEEEFPLRFYLNLGRREDRRTEVEWTFDQAGVTANRFPAIDARFVRNPRGYEKKGRYALALSMRMAIRKAKQAKAKSLLLFEDDVILHPNFTELVSRLELPSDWGLFYFGCQHVARPIPVSEGLVRVSRALDAHARAIHESAYDDVLKAIDAIRHPNVRHALAQDQFVAGLHQQIPTYSCYPNLAWQSFDESDLTGTEYTLYGRSGAQLIRPQLLDKMMTECFAPEVLRKPVKLGLLFLTIGDVHHPKIWQDWAAQAPDKIAVFTHAKDPSLLNDGFLDGTQIEGRIDTAWGDISLVRASIALLKVGLKDESITHFALVSESCVPIQPLCKVLQTLEHDGRCQFGFRDVTLGTEISKFRFGHVEGIPKETWRFHQQWWLLDRVAAKMVTRKDYTSRFEMITASDEGYFGTILAMEGYPVDDLVYNRDVTWTHWKKLEEEEEAALKKTGRLGQAGRPESHPQLKKEHLVRILRSNALFARKFPPEADIGKYNLHLPTL